MNAAVRGSWVVQSGEAAYGEMRSCSQGPTAAPLSPGSARGLRMGCQFLQSSSPAREETEASEISLVYSCSLTCRDTV